MTYTKPEVILNTRAVKAVQSSMTKVIFQVDGNQIDPTSVSAYEADE